MESLEPVGQLFDLVLGLLLYISISYAIPREMIRGRLQRHYRDWIVASNAYWGRAYDKWIINHRIYYTDEFWGDVLVCVLCGFLGALGGTYAFVMLTDRELVGFLLIPTIPSTGFLMFALVQADRMRLIDAEIAVRRLIDPQFNDQLELRKVLEGDRRWVKRVLGPDPSKK